MIKRLTKSLGALLHTEVNERGGRGGFAEQRRVPRSRSRLPVKASVLGIELEVGNAKYSQSLSGHTDDLSVIGLSFVVPEKQIEALDLLKGHHRRLQIVLGLPSYPVEVFATVVRVGRARERRASDDGGLIGVRITKMNREDKFILLNYLNPSVGNSGGCADGEDDDLLFDELSLLG